MKHKFKIISLIISLAILLPQANVLAISGGGYELVGAQVIPLSGAVSGAGFNLGASMQSAVSGKLTGGGYSVSAGVPLTVSTTTPPTTSTPTVNSGGASSLFAITGSTPPQPINTPATPSQITFTAIPGQEGIKLYWENINQDEVVIVRSESGYPLNLTDGEKIYDGSNKTTTDQSVKDGKKYYYSLFTKSGESKTALAYTESRYSTKPQDPLDKQAPFATSVKVKFVTCDSVTVIYDSNEKAYGAVSFGMLGEDEIKYTSTPLESFVSSNHVVRINALTQAKEYAFVLFLEDVNGNGQMLRSDTYKFSTLPNCDALDSKVPPVVNAVALQKDNGVLLSWKNPEFKGLSKVILVRSLVDYPQTPSDGELIYDGLDQEYFDQESTMGKIYFYTFFAVDSNGRYSLGTPIRSQEGEVLSINGKEVEIKDGINWNRMIILFLGLLLVLLVIIKKRNKVEILLVTPEKKSRSNKKS